MNQDAEIQRKKYLHLNEVVGPAFKIRHDPRLTPFGKLLRLTGLDELPQLLNVLTADMSLVGPRPLPVNEARRLLSWQKKRETVLPGITSPWIVYGAHKLSFTTWMRMDQDYIKNQSILLDLTILFLTIKLIIKNTLKAFSLPLRRFWR